MRLICKRDPNNPSHAFPEEPSERVRDTRTPIVADHRELPEMQRVGEINGILRERDTSTVSNGAIREEPGLAKPPQIWRNRVEASRVQPGGHVEPASRSVRPAVQQHDGGTIGGAALVESDLQNAASYAWHLSIYSGSPSVAIGMVCGRITPPLSRGGRTPSAPQPRTCRPPAAGAGCYATGPSELD